MIDVNAVREPMLVLVFRARPASPRRPAQRPHRARPSVTSPHTSTLTAILNPTREVLKAFVLNGRCGRSTVKLRL